MMAAAPHTNKLISLTLTFDLLILFSKSSRKFHDGILKQFNKSYHADEESDMAEQSTSLSMISWPVHKIYLLVYLDDRLSEEWCDGGKHAAVDVCNVKLACHRHHKPDSTLPYPDVLQQ